MFPGWIASRKRPTPPPNPSRAHNRVPKGSPSIRIRPTFVSFRNLLPARTVPLVRSLFRRIWTILIDPRLRDFLSTRHFRSALHDFIRTLPSCFRDLIERRNTLPTPSRSENLPPRGVQIPAQRARNPYAGIWTAPSLYCSRGFGTDWLSETRMINPTPPNGDPVAIPRRHGGQNARNREPEWSC